MSAARVYTRITVGGLTGTADPADPGHRADARRGDRPATALRRQVAERRAVAVAGDHGLRTHQVDRCGPATVIELAGDDDVGATVWLDDDGRPSRAVVVYAWDLADEWYGADALELLLRDVRQHRACAAAAEDIVSLDEDRLRIGDQVLDLPYRVGSQWRQRMVRHPGPYGGLELLPQEWDPHRWTARVDGAMTRPPTASPSDRGWQPWRRVAGWTWGRRTRQITTRACRDPDHEHGTTRALEPPS